MRRAPLHAARVLGSTTRVWRGLPIVYIIVVFILIPLLLLGISSLFTQDCKGYTVLGFLITVVLILFIALLTLKWYKGGLKESTVANLEARQRKSAAYNSLPDDMEMLKAKIERLSQHTGLPEDPSPKE